MKTYIVNVASYGTCDGKRHAMGATLFADQLTPGRIVAGLRMGHLVAGDDLEKPKPKPAPVAEVIPVDAAEIAAEPPVSPAGDDEPAGFADERLDASIDTLDGVEPAALEALKAAELLCIGDLVEHLQEHGSLVGVAQGIGKGRAEQLAKALAPYLPAAA